MRGKADEVERREEELDGLKEANAELRTGRDKAVAAQVMFAPLSVRPEHVMQFGCSARVVSSCRKHMYGSTPCIESSGSWCVRSANQIPLAINDLFGLLCRSGQKER